MEKKILIAVDGSMSSDQAVDYVGLMAEKLISDLWVVLLFVMDPIPPFLRKGAGCDRNMFKQRKALEEKNRQHALEVLERARERLLRRGMDGERIETKALPRTADAAKDILFEAEHGLYDAVVLGRRGLSKTQELFVGSVTNKVVQHAQRLPIWVVGGPVKSLKVLCAVDGSEGSLRAVDHMAFLLGGAEECEITLFHAGASLQEYCALDFDSQMEEEIDDELLSSQTRCMDDFYLRAVRLLRQAGVDPGRISAKTQPGGLSVAGSVLKEIKRGGYGTVVLGRRGENNSFFLGHVSDRVMAKASKAAVWIAG